MFVTGYYYKYLVDIFCIIVLCIIIFTPFIFIHYIYIDEAEYILLRRYTQ
jgi:hypothetical protein